MRRLIQTLVALLACSGASLGAGCAHRNQNHALLGMAGVTLGTIAVVQFRDDSGGDSGCNDGPGCAVLPSGADVVSGALLITAVVLGVTAAVGLARNAAADYAARQRAAEPAPDPGRTLAAMRREAQAYAEDDDCERTRHVAAEIQATNAAYYRDRIAPDPLIAACLPR